MSERRWPPSALHAALPQADALAAWLLLGWLGQRLGWSVASGVLPVVMWWTVRCASAALGAQRAMPGLWTSAGTIGALGATGSLLALALLPTGPASLGLLLLVSALWGVWSASIAAGSGRTDPTLPGQAMGLMMGSLWLSSQWCLGPGWTDAQAVALHLGLMAGIPLLLAALRQRKPAAATVSPRQAAALLATGALLMAWPDAPDGRLAGMALLVLAWALSQHGAQPVGAPRIRSFTPAAPGLGPALLLAAGLLAPTHGPAAMHAVWWCVAGLALVSLAPRQWSRPFNAQRWRDAS